MINPIPSKSFIEVAATAKQACDPVKKLLEKHKCLFDRVLKQPNSVQPKEIFDFSKALSDAMEICGKASREAMVGHGDPDVFEKPLEERKKYLASIDQAIDAHHTVMNASAFIQKLHLIMPDDLRTKVEALTEKMRRSLSNPQP